MLSREADEDAIAAELKSLVGWGATPERLSQLPSLSLLQSVLDNTTSRSRGKAILSELQAALEDLDGQYHLDGIEQPLSAQAVRQAANLLLGLTPSSRSYAAPRAPAFSPYAPYVRFSLDGCAILWPGESPSPAVRSPMR